MGKNVGPRLTHQKLRFVKEYMENGGNASEAARQTYSISEKSQAGVKGHELINDDAIRGEIQAQMAAQGLSIGWIIEKHKDLAEFSENDMVKTKNLEDLADYAGMKPRASRTKVEADKEGLIIEWSEE